MLKTVSLIVILFAINFSIAQNTDTLYNYSFKIENIDNDGSAKAVIVDLRLITNQKLISFNNDTDFFLVKSRFNYVEQDLIQLIESNGYNIIE